MRNLQYFSYNDSIYGHISDSKRINLFSVSSHQLIKTLDGSLKINWASNIIPLTSNNGLIYFFNQNSTTDLNCIILNTKDNTIKQKSINYEFLPIMYNGTYSLFRLIITKLTDDVLLVPKENKIIRFNLSNSEVDSLTFGENKIEGLCAIKDNMIAVITRNKEMETVIDLVDNSFTKFKTITLPKREDVIQYCNITSDNQLRIIYSNKYGNLYLCRVPILDIALSSVAESKSEEEPLVFPNPASNSISIQYPLSPIATIRIVDEAGKIYLAKISSANADNFSIDTSLLPDGIYFVQIRDGEINKSAKLVVSR